MSAIFISHSSRDSASAAELKTWLSERGFRSLFLDFDPELGIPAGRNWERELYRQLRACQAVIVLCSEHSMQSDWCFVEITHARALGKYIFPLRIAPCEVRPPLTELQVIEAITDRPQAYERLLQGLRMAGLDDPAIWDGSRPPYPGLMAFQEADAAVFFGRDSDIRSGLDTLNRLRRFGGTRMLICVGASGSGKSSLVRAGLLPRLRQDPDTWLTLPPFRPLQRPIEEMAMTLASAFAQGKPEHDWKAIAADLERTAGETDPAASLRNLLRDLRQACNRREATAIITIDQFEEALVVTEQAQRFIRLVRAFADDPDGQGIVLGTLRSDFLSALQSHPALQGMLYETLSLGPLPVDGVIQVIEGPARVAGLDLAPELTQMLLADTEAEDGLPLLAFTLRELWEQDGKTGCLTVETYRGKLGGLHGSVARAAEAVLAAESLSPEQEVDLRGAFLAMARIDESGQYMRQAVQWDALPSRIHPLLERFVRAHLLVAGSEGKQRVLEVAHEALFRVWERAKAWLDADRENLRLREGLRRAAREWDERGRIPELLVHRGNRLDAVEALVGQAGFPLEAVQRDYLQTCIAARKAEQEAEHRQAAARRRRVRLTIAGLATGLVLVSALGVWASMERNEAKRRLASLHWINGVNERDRNDDQLKAVHHFVQAAALASNATDAKNAHFAAALLAGNTRLMAILQPREGIRSAAFAADRGDVITWSETGTAHRWDAQSSQQHFPAVHEGSARKLVTSPRGKWVILQSGDGATEVLDGQRGQRAAATPLAIGLPLFNESETRFAIVGHKGDVQIWDRRSDTPITSLVHPGAVLGAALSRDGERIVTWDEQRDVRVWTADGGKKLGEIRNRSDIIGATFRADGKQVLVWGKEGPASLWNTEEARVVELTLRGAHNTTRNSNIMGAAFVGDGRQRIVTWNYGEIGVALLWSTEKGAEPERLAHTGEIRSATFNRNGSQILTWGDDGMARVWNSKDGTPLIALRHDSNVRGATFSPDETQVLTWSDDRTARVWDARDGQPLSLPMRHAGTVEGAAFSTDGRSILSWDQHAARIWRLEPDPERRVLSLRHEQAVLTATFAPEQSEVLTITDNGQLYRWRGGEKKQPALALSHGIVGATWDADRRRAVGWSMDHAVGLWSTENGQALTPPMRHDKSPLGIQGVAPSPDGSRILSWGDDHTARLWDSANGKRLALLRHPGAVSGARQSADNSRILTWGDDRVVRLWDAESQKMLLALPAHDYGVQGATLTQNKARILTWDTNGVLRFWDAGDGAAIKQISHSTGVPIRGAVFTRDESRLLVWDEESVGIWSIEGRGIPSAVRWSADDLQKAGFNADESVVVTQGGDGAVRFWESRYGYPLTVPLVLDGHVQGALLSQDEKSFLAWTQSVVKVWNVAVDYGQSGAITAQTLEARTGTRLDRLGELEVIPTDVWKKMRGQFDPARPSK